MTLTTIDNEKIVVEVCMIKEFHRRGTATLLITKINDRLLIKETPAELLSMINSRKEVKI